MKKIAIGTLHRERILNGINLVNELVGASLGPWGSSSILDRGFSVPIISTDGVSIARAIEVEDDVERMGVELIKHVSIKTNEMAGDGTTTSVVLSHALIEEGLRYSENPKDIKRSLDKANEKVVNELKKLSKPIKTNKEILQVAALSADSEQLGKIIADTIGVIGRDGVISVEENNRGSAIETRVAEGYEVEKGYVSSFMVNTLTGRAEYKNVDVLVIGDKLSTVSEILPFLQKLSQKTKELVIFCTEIDPGVINTFLFNKQQSSFNILAVRCNSQKNEILEDVALITGAKFVSKESGFKFEEMDLSVLGKAERITASKDKTVIISKGNIKKKIQQLRASLITAENDNEYDLIEKRIARLQGGVAIISVGAKTETEMRDLYYKMEDAVNATKSAIEEGIVEGGGMTFYKITKTLGNTIGERILKKALLAPLKKIIENSGRDYTEIIANMPKNKGYDAQNDTYVDMFKAGIIDPTKVERCCVENAVSFVGSFLVSKSTVALVRETPKNEA